MNATLEQARQQVNSNNTNGRYSFEGMTSAAIAAYNRALMFGDNDEAFNEEEFRAVTS